MPRPSVWFIRMSLAHFLAGVTLGALLLTANALHMAPTLGRVRPVHVELLLVGWIVQLAMGVALWIFPRGRLRAVAGTGSGPWIVFGLLNAGVVLAAVGGSIGTWPLMTTVGRAAEAAAAGVFAAVIWARVRPGLSPM